MSTTDRLEPQAASAALPAAPVMKLVIAVEGRTWTGQVYPTQRDRGARQRFSSREELVSVLRSLTGWESDGGS